MRLICFSPRYYPAVGGAENYIIALAERFAADGHHVTVITTDALDFQIFWQPTAKRVNKNSAVSTHNAVDIVRLPVHHLPFTPLSYHAWRRGLWYLSHLPIFPVRWLARLARQTPRIPEIWQLKNSLQADAVIGLNICYEPLLWGAKRLANQLNAPFVAVPFTHLGAGETPGGDGQSGFYTMRHQVKIVHLADIALVQTQSEKDFYVSQGGEAEKIQIASAGIDPEQYTSGAGGRWRTKHNIPKSTPIIAYIGTHDYDKGTTHLIEAADILWRHGVEFKLVLAGSQTAEFDHYLKSLSKDTRQRIDLLGRITDSDKQDLLSALDIFVMPSRIDSFGIVFLEAWLYGKPVIGSTAWGMADVICEKGDRQDGLLTPFGDPQTLAQNIQTLITNPEKRQRMGQNGRAKTIAQHTWDKKYATVKHILSDLIQKGAS